VISLLFNPGKVNLKFDINPKIPPILGGLNEINTSMGTVAKRLDQGIRANITGAY
jgi:hypothetical protein